MGGSGLQWSFSGKPDSPSQFLSFKPSSEGGNHSIYAPGFVQKVVSSEKIATTSSSSLVNRQPQNYGALVAKTGRLVSSSLSLPNGVNGVGCRANPESIGSAFKLPATSVPGVSSSAVVGSTNLCSGESLFNGPSQMTIFYNGLVCVYDDVAPDKAQAIMLLAGTGNSRSQNPAEHKAKARPIVVSSPSSSIHTKPDDLSGSKPAPANPPNDPVCSSKNEANPRNPAPKFPTPASNQIRLAKSALPVDPVSSGAPTSAVDVSPKNPVSRFPSPILGSSASNQIRFHQSAIPVDLDSAGPSTTSTVEFSPRNPPLRYPSPSTGSTGTNRFRFSPSNITIDPVLAAASISKIDSLNNPTTKFAPPATGSVASNQIRFSPSAHGSSGRIEVSSNNPATKFPPPATGSVGSNQIRFSQSAVASTAAIEVNPKTSTSNFTPPSTGSNGLNQIRFSRSAIPIDHGSAGAPISIVESNPIKPTAKFSDPASSSGSNQFRFPQSVERNPIRPVSQNTGIHQLPQNTTSKDPPARASNSIVENNPIKPTTKFSDQPASNGSNQLRYLHSIERDSASARASNNTIESNPKMATTRFSDPKTGSGSNQICFSQSGMALSNRDRSMSGSSTPDLVKPVSPATSVDRASAGASSSSIEASEAKATSKIPTSAKGSGEPNQLRFSQSGVPLARKASLARFLEKRKERPGEVGSLGDFPPAKYRSNSE